MELKVISWNLIAWGILNLAILGLIVYFIYKYSKKRKLSQR